MFDFMNPDLSTSTSDLCFRGKAITHGHDTGMMGILFLCRYE